MNSQPMMDITPYTNFLKSLRGDRVDYVVLAGEGVDNAFDAGASRVAISINKEEITFEDDGCGITQDRLSALFRLGEHGAMTTTQLGRFGMGIKTQAVNAGDILEVTSVSAEGRVRVLADWRDVLKSGVWKIPAARWFPYVVGTPTSTLLSISRLRQARFDPDKLKWQLAMRFDPALRDGRRVFLNGQPIAPLPEPVMTDEISAYLDLSGGRSAQLRAGILCGPSALRGVHVAYRHRVIMPGSNVGCKTYAGLNKMFARLTIDGPWHLAKFKDDLTGEDEREELEEAVFEKLQPILEKVDAASMSARVTEMRDLLNDKLPVELRAAPSGQGGKKPGVKRETKPGKVEPEKARPEGPAKSNRPPKTLLQITFDGVADEHGVGNFEPGRPHRVNLSRDDPFIDRFLRVREQQLAVDALYGQALCLFVQGMVEHRLQPDLFDEPFGKTISMLLAKQAQDHESDDHGVA